MSAALNTMAWTGGRGEAEGKGQARGTWGQRACELQIINRNGDRGVRPQPAGRLTLKLTG
jgi:hypothetical protein